MWYILRTRNDDHNAHDCDDLDHDFHRLIDFYNLPKKFCEQCGKALDARREVGRGRGR